ncbi:MAG: hypothetical protein BWY52_03254 [Chloroflexi bacterium ADurb.Bin325]|nr:MAG: hypothetical protein BWY52_03254 [Chloroflexi bacterium ADurb.Bin325]
MDERPVTVGEGLGLARGRDQRLDLADAFDNLRRGQQGRAGQVRAQLLVGDEVEIAAQGAGGLYICGQAQPEVRRGRAAVLAALHGPAQRKHLRQRSLRPRREREGRAVVRRLLRGIGQGDRVFRGVARHGRAGHHHRVLDQMAAREWQHGADVHLTVVHAHAGLGHVDADRAVRTAAGLVGRHQPAQRGKRLVHQPGVRLLVGQPHRPHEAGHDLEGEQPALRVHVQRKRQRGRRLRQPQAQQRDHGRGQHRHDRLRQMQRDPAAAAVQIQRASRQDQAGGVRHVHPHAAALPQRLEAEGVVRRVGRRIVDRVCGQVGQVAAGRIPAEEARLGPRRGQRQAGRAQVEAQPDRIRVDRRIPRAELQQGRVRVLRRLLAAQRAHDPAALDAAQRQILHLTQIAMILRRDVAPARPVQKGRPRGLLRGLGRARGADAGNLLGGDDRDAFGRAAEVEAVEHLLPGGPGGRGAILTVRKLGQLRQGGLVAAQDLPRGRQIRVGRLAQLGQAAQRAGVQRRHILRADAGGLPAL